MFGYFSEKSNVVLMVARGLLGVILFLFLTMPVSAADIISIAVDPCTLPLTKKLAEAFAKRTNTYFSIASGPCMSGVKKVTAGEVSVGVSTQNMAEAPAGCSKVVLAKAPIVLIVNKKNKVNNLSLEQLKKIFSGEINNWKEVGGKDLPIKLVMLEPCVMTTLSNQVCHYGETIETRKVFPFVRVNAVEDTNRLVEEDIAAIGQTLYGYESSKVRVLAIDGYLPSEKTFPSEYKLYEDYNLITLGESVGKVKEFINFALSPEGQTIVSSLKHIPVMLSK
ncbi:MAG TPA: substrate-binding domain-containing protein [Candidatus Hypogeohydataceae bacterium YC40]